MAELKDTSTTYTSRADEEETTQKKKSGGGCSGGGAGAGAGASSSSSSASGSSSDGSSNSSPLSVGDTDESVNKMCKKVYTVYRAIPKDPEYQCPIAQRDNVADQFTPQDDLLVMEKTVRDFLKLEGKIYDPETTNPRFFASEDWVKHYEKDKNVILAAMDQFKANIIRMEHLYTVVDNNSYSKLLTIPNQDCKEEFQVNVLWTARALKDWGDNWFIKRNAYSCTPIYEGDFWLPGITGWMVKQMKVGNYKEVTQVRPVSIETMIAKVDRLEGWIDRLMNPDAVSETISKNVNMKETLEKSASQSSEQVFTSSIIDSQMGKKLGVSNTGVTNQKTEGTTYIAPKEDDVEKVTLRNKLSCVKSLFQSLRENSMTALKSCRCVSCCGAGDWPEIYCKINDLAQPLYRDLDIMNELIEDFYGDFETPGKHCSVTHAPMEPCELKEKITTFRCIIKQGVIDVMTNQAKLPKKGLNILDSMFNQLWEYSEKGPTIELPSWCREAIDSINGFENSLMCAWSEVYDCWEREFLTRLWNIELDHHTGNFERTQIGYVRHIDNHQHPFVPLTMMTLASIGGASKSMDIGPLRGVLSCPGHLEKLMAPVCIQYRTWNIAHLSRHFRSDVKALCQWMSCAIQAVGIKLSAISAVMTDPTLNGDCENKEYLEKINELRDKNMVLLKKAETAYGIYSDVNNMKNKQDYQDEIALAELQPNEYSNEDQLNMSSSVQSETKEDTLSAELCQGGIDIKELKPWNHLSLSENKVTPPCVPATCVCNKFDKIIKSAANFETMFGV